MVEWPGRCSTPCSGCTDAPRVGAGRVVGWLFVTVYVPEDFTPAEADILRRYFTNLDGPVFALVNLPEVVKGALFAALQP